MHIKREYEVEAKKNFKNHEATYVEYSGGLAVLDWRNKDGSSTHYIRYVFDGCNLYISGDVGTVVVRLTEKATLATLAGYLDMVNYFVKKIQCSSDLYLYDFATASKVLDQHLIDALDDKEYDDPDDKQTALEDRYDLKSDLLECLDSCTGWTVGNDLTEKLSEIDPDYIEWLYTAGRDLHPRVAYWLWGLYLAYHQIRRKEAES